MATAPEDDVLELGEAPEQQDDQQVDIPNAEQEDGSEDEDLAIPTFGDVGDEEEGDTDLVRHLRAQLRERDKKLKEAGQGKKPEPEIVVGPEPDIEDEEFNWDKDKWKAAWSAWNERKQKAEAKANEGKESLQRAQQELAQVVTAYNEKKAALPYPDKDDMEATVLAALTPAQQEIAIRVAGDSAKLFYALGRNPAKLAALATMAVTDMATVAKFGAAIAKLDGELKMSKRRPTAEPDRPVRGSGQISTPTADKELARLEKEADLTNDRTKVIAYKRELKQKQAAA